MHSMPKEFTFAATYLMQLVSPVCVQEPMLQSHVLVEHHLLAMEYLSRGDIIHFMLVGWNILTSFMLWHTTHALPKYITHEQIR